jgi:putative hydrolase of the HAD superfamily
MPAPRPLRAALVDFGYTLVHYEVPDALLLESYREAEALLATRYPDKLPPTGLVLRVARHVLAAVTASYERGEIEELDHHLLLAEALAQHGYEPGLDLLGELLDLEQAAFVRHLLVPEATHAALAQLRARGLRLGLVSNVSIPGTLMRRALDTLDLACYFDVAVFSSEVGVRKPHPRIYETVLAGLGVEPAQAVFIGDRVLEDIRGPQALGLRAVLTHEYRQEPPNGVQPDALVHRFADFPQVLEYLGPHPLPDAGRGQGG